MAQNIFQLIYMSRANDNLSYTDLHGILDRSRFHNNRHEITGILIYRDHHFLQLLEGDEAVVKETVSRIVRDRRNHHLQVLHEMWSPHRLFAGWSMAFQDGDLACINNQPLIHSLFGIAQDKDVERPGLEIMSPMTELARRYVG